MAVETGIEERDSLVLNRRLCCLLPDILVTGSAEFRDLIPQQFLEGRIVGVVAVGTAVFDCSMNDAGLRGFEFLMTPETEGVDLS